MTISRRGFIGSGGGLAIAAIVLPNVFLDAASAAASRQQPMDGWVPLIRTCTAHGFEVSLDVLHAMAANFTKPVPIDIDFHSLASSQALPQYCGWVSEVRVVGDELHARLELPSFGLALLKDYKAVVPAFVTRYQPGDARLVGAALTNHPSIPLT